MSQSKTITISVIHSPSNTDAVEFEGCITRSRNQTIGIIMNEIIDYFKDIPHDNLCSMVIGKKQI